MEKEKKEEALQDLQTALELNPEHVPAYSRLLSLHLQAGEMEQAIACLEAALRVRFSLLYDTIRK